MQLTATLTASDPGSLSGEVLVLMAWDRDGGGNAGGSTGGSRDPGSAECGPQWEKEPAARCPAGASVVACSYDLRSEGGSAVKAVSTHTWQDSGVWQ